MTLWHVAMLATLTALMGQPGGAPLTQEEKDALLSRQEWYVTMDFTLSGRGGTRNGSWRYGNRSNVSLVLNNAIPGQWPLSTPAEPDFVLQPGRFISWMALPTEAGFAAAERGESNPARLENQYYPAYRSTNESYQIETLSGTFSGAASTFAIGPCMLSFDLDKGTYDVVTQVGPTDLGPPIRHEWIDRERSGVEDAIPTHHIAWLAQELAPQLAKRSIRSDMKADGSIAFTLSGTTTVNGRLGRVTPTATATFRFSPTPPRPAELIIEPEDAAVYAAWRPMPGDSEDEPGNEIKIAWTVEQPGVPPAERAKVTKVTFRLGNVSRHPGVCMNWPRPTFSPPGATAPKAKPDLQFKPAEFSAMTDYTVTDEGQVAYIGGADAEAEVGDIAVECFDGAAIGEVIAEAELSDGRILQAIVRGQPATRKILIPDREEGVSEIARAWRSEKAAGLADESDDEQIPAGDAAQGPGDGLSVWEEYRGFFQGGDAALAIERVFEANAVPELPVVLLSKRTAALEAARQAQPAR